MKKLLSKKLSAFIVIAMMFYTSANAQIFYTDVNPDVLITDVNPDVLLTTGNYNLDLNNDGTNDFLIKANKKEWEPCGHYRQEFDISVFTLGTNQVADTSNNLFIDLYATKIALNANIDSSLNWINYGSNPNYMAIDWSRCYPPYAYFTDGLWYDAVDGYLGLKLISGGNTHYGWVRISTSGAWNFTVKDYAYNSIPNQPILAGDIGCTIPPFTVAASGWSSFCAGGSVTLSAPAINQRYASTVINFSSQYTPTDWSANQTLGAPNVYPSYGSNPIAWSPNGDPREFITLGFTNPSPINYIDIYETYMPGAIDTVYVKNPATGLFEVVYSTSAALFSNSTARKLHISFPMTTFNVSEIRIAINDAAIGSWNEIDAVSIGKQGTPNYLWSTGATTQTIAVNTSGIFTVTVTNASGCTGSASITTTALVAPVITGNLTPCAGSTTTTLSTGVYSSYLWSTGATTQSITVAANLTLTYKVTVTNASGCTASASAKVIKKALPIITVTPADTILCPPVTGMVLTAAGNAATYSWSPATGLNQTTGTVVTASPIVTSIYIVTGTNAFGCTATKSVKITVKPNPVNLSTTNITASSAKANWSPVSCAVGYKLQYRKQGVTTWTTANITTNNPTKTISGLLAATTYQWRVSSKFAGATFSAYSTIASFTTLVVRSGIETIESTNELVVYPNPATDKLNLEFPFTEGDANISIVNALGQTLLVQKVKTTGEAIELNIQSLPAGLYFIAVQNGDNTFNSRFIKN